MRRHPLHTSRISQRFCFRLKIWFLVLRLDEKHTGHKQAAIANCWCAKLFWRRAILIHLVYPAEKRDNLLLFFSVFKNFVLCKTFRCERVLKQTWTLLFSPAFFTIFSAKTFFLKCRRISSHITDLNCILRSIVCDVMGISKS